MKKHKIRLIGDIHGDYEFYRKAIKRADADSVCTIQLGDFGLGFHLMRDYLITNESEIDWSKHKFIRGNHDNPEDCQDHPGYLGDYGYIEELDLFYISGAYSIDKDWRIPDVSWWQLEELTEEQMKDCLELYSRSKPKYVISHDAPLRVNLDMHYSTDKGVERFPNRTMYFLEDLMKIHEPADYYFGHMHLRYEKQIGGTRFVCVDINEERDIIL